MTRAHAFARRARILLRLGPRRQMLLAEAAATLLVARILLARVPFGRLSRRFGTLVAPNHANMLARREATARDRTIARRIGWAIRTVAPHVPFRARCLQQATAAHAMLSRRGVSSVMHFGLDPGRQAVGHAWLEAAGVAVTGFPIGAALVELGCFIPVRQEAA